MPVQQLVQSLRLIMLMLLIEGCTPPAPVPDAITPPAAAMEDGRGAMNLKRPGDWHWVMRDNVGNFYAVDRGDIVRTGSLSRIWTLRNFVTATDLQDGRSYVSMLALVEINCPLATRKTVQSQFFARRGALGNMVGENNQGDPHDFPVVPGSLSDIIKKEACKGV